MVCVTIVTVLMMLVSELANFLEGTSDAAFTVDLRGEILTWNRSAEKLFGYPPSMALGTTCDTLVAGRLGAAQVCCECCDIIECARAGRDIPNFDMEVKTRSGERIWVNVSILVASNERRQRHLAVHLMRDIRKRKSTENLTSRVLRMARSLVDGADEAGVLRPIAPLTEQERKILRLLAAGIPTKEVTSELQISARTLRNHLFHINRKLHTHSRIEAVIEAHKRGII